MNPLIKTTCEYIERYEVSQLEQDLAEFNTS